MTKFYVPTDNVYNKCYVYQSENIIRAYDTIPRQNTTYKYRDYYIKSDYYFKDNTGNWGNTSNLPICIDNNLITHDFYYRLDFPNILLMFFIFSVFCFYLPFKIIKSLVRGLK